MNEYSMMTQELQDLAALSMEHGQIPSGLYDQYHVLRGLRDVNGKGVLAGLTDISTITSSKEVDGKMVPCDGELRYRGYDIHDLVDGFVAEQRFARLGVFAYSQEEGTVAGQMPNQIDEEIKTERADSIMRLQMEISLEENRSKIDTVQEVIVDEIDEDGSYIGRTRYDAPEIDNAVIFTGKQEHKPGDMVMVHIDDAFDYDLAGTEV